jgi:hypothetical protein
LWGILGNKFKHEDFLSEDERKKERADSFCVTQERPSALFLTVHRNDKFTKTTYRDKRARLMQATVICVLIVIMVNFPSVFFDL